MTRRDFIIVAALVNAGLLALLFMFATNSDDDKVSEPTDMVQTVLEITPTETAQEPTVIALTPSAALPVDEVDNALKEYSANPTPQQIIIDDDTMADQEDMDSPNIATTQPELTETPAAKASETKFVDITVKRGDSLDRIARANKTTVQAIREANNLKKDLLSVGQKLRVPVSSGDKSSTTAKAAAKSAKAESKQIAQGDAQYYTVKSGDNPWKIAKQFKLKVDDLLKLNNLDEDKARNMKVGDRIRVK